MKVYPCSNPLSTVQENAIHTFWYNPTNGNTLDELSIACIRSWAHQQSAVYIWTYAPFNNPELAELLEFTDNILVIDANMIIPKDKYFLADYSLSGLHSFAMFSDLFRIKLLNQFGGYWLDTDVLLGPIDIIQYANNFNRTRPNVWVERFSNTTQETKLNNAVIYCPKPGMLDVVENLVQNVIDSCSESGSSGVWGNTGPELFTNNRNLFMERPKHEFYFVGFEHIKGELYRYAYSETSAKDLLELKRNQVLGYHLWHSALYKNDVKRAPKSLFSMLLSLANSMKPLSFSNIIAKHFDKL